MGNDTHGQSHVKVIKEFFESGVHGRPVQMSELKALSKEERQELADMIRALDR